MNQKMKMDLVNESAYRLETWTKSLLELVRRDLPRIRSILEGKESIPEGATDWSWSYAHLGEIYRALKDVIRAYDDLDKYIRAD